MEFRLFCEEQVLEAVEHRQVVLTVPKRVRWAFRKNRKLLGKLSRLGWEVIRQARVDGAGVKGVPGGITRIQTDGSLLDFHPHLHMVVSWGVFDGKGAFHRVRQMPGTRQLEEMFRAKVFSMLLQEGYLDEAAIRNMLGWRHTGFGVYVGEPIILRRAKEGEGVEGAADLLEYIARGSVSLERMQWVEETGEVIYKADRVHPGRKANFRVMGALDFLAQLAEHIPGRYERMMNYYGRYSNRSRGKRRREGYEGPASEAEAVKRSRGRGPEGVREAWAKMIRMVWETDPLLCECGGKMKVVGVLQEGLASRKFLEHLGQWEGPVEMQLSSVPRAPPVGDTEQEGAVDAPLSEDWYVQEGPAEDDQGDQGDQGDLFDGAMGA